MWIFYMHTYIPYPSISYTIKLVPLRTSTPSKSGQQQTGFFSADGVTPLGSVYWRGVLRLSSSLRAFRNLSQWHQRTLGFDPWQHGRIMTLAGNSEKMWPTCLATFHKLRPRHWGSFVLLLNSLVHPPRVWSQIRQKVIPIWISIAIAWASKFNEHQWTKFIVWTCLNCPFANPIQVLSLAKSMCSCPAQLLSESAVPVSRSFCRSL